MTEHNPLHFVTQLGAKLASRGRHVAVLLGAGASKACGLPDVAGLQESVLEALDDPYRDLLGDLLDAGDLESALSRIRRIASLLGEDDGAVSGLTGPQAVELDQLVCRAIIDTLQAAAANGDLASMKSLAAWASRADYESPLEIFSLNYDLLLETALEDIRVPYFDGFIGTMAGRFHPDQVEQAPPDPNSIPRHFVRLWKLHGSVNWTYSGDGPLREIVRIGTPATGTAAIYPSDTKYEESRRVPFVVLQDRLRRSLHQPETVMLVSGYSFGDDHVNELLFDAAVRRPRSEIVAFCYDQLPDVVAERALITPNLQAVSRTDAVISGTRAEWAWEEGDLPGIWEADAFALHDFARLSAFLARAATPQAAPVDPEGQA